MMVLVSMTTHIERQQPSSHGRVLVVGMGVTGTATAARLRAAGWTPVIVERAEQRRRGGYFVGLFQSGMIAADRLGILAHLHDRNPEGRSYLANRAGRRGRTFSMKDLPGQPWLMLRGDAEEAAFATLPDDVEVRYSTVPTAIIQDEDGVDVTLYNAVTGQTVTERFALVVGADGLRSTVRKLAFGPHEDYLHRLGYMVAAFEFPGTPAGLEPGMSIQLVEPDRAMWVFAFADHNPTIMISYRTDDVDAEFTRPAPERIREVFSDRPLGTTLSDVLDALDHADNVLFDSAEQVRAQSWHRGRVVLVGDSAWCVTLYAGMGVSAGLIGADLLGEVLERHPGDVATALSEWEQGLRPFIEEYQEVGLKQRPFFVPDGPRQIRMRWVMSALTQFAVGRRLLSKVLEGSVEVRTSDITARALQALSTAPAHQANPVRV
ncbi:FAD-dependent oxidoreductase [Mycolicibacterium murale]|uniref:FAD-dependent oxidoreductase n=2 Tax=Mycolicibacterium murale TaxID=182220 RepID=A0A7I9WL09_9MYCO|nr:FAD-dependent monooxygenase [Mycolicibacterium murale]GFG57966.1 FAD-dependent oxidoreductase [Mycolicibacterium murale]